jgi:uncharacterized protein involved in exopolysaccharide biosynthesis
MTPEREDEVEETARGMARGAEELEERLGHLGDQIEDAKTKAADRREDAGIEDAAGDWEEESSGAQQGDDAQDFDDPEAEEPEEG